MTQMSIGGRPLLSQIEILDSIYRGKNEREGVLTSMEGALMFIAGGLKQLNSDQAKCRGGSFGALLPLFTKRVLVAVTAFGPVNFINSLMAKYPAGGCSYCHQNPCDCGVTKSADWSTRISPITTQYDWSLDQWQTHHAAVYGLKNMEKTRGDLLTKLTEEFCELMVPVYGAGILTRARGGLNQYAHGQLTAEVAQELSDLFMRTLALANEWPVALEPAIEAAYRQGCRVCHANPCQCQNPWDGTLSGLKAVCFSD
jgi:hypothetical protein